MNGYGFTGSEVASLLNAVKSVLVQYCQDVWAVSLLQYATKGSSVNEVSYNASFVSASRIEKDT